MFVILFKYIISITPSLTLVEDRISLKFLSSLPWICDSPLHMADNQNFLFLQNTKPVHDVSTSSWKMCIGLSWGVSITLMGS